VRVILDQRWRDLTFLHWPVDPAAVTRFMPPGARVDCWEGRTYVGLVPFFMHDVRFGRSLRLPYVGSFGEVNVRLYSVDEEGRHGVVFRSLDCSRLATVAVARSAGVPYVWSHVSVEGGEGSWSYQVRRRDGSGDLARIGVTVGEPVTPTPLEDRLTARWGMHASWRGRPVWLPNRHEAWPLHTARLTELDDSLVAAAGIELAGPMLRPLWSPGVHAQFGPPVLGRTGWSRESA